MEIKKGVTVKTNPKGRINDYMVDDLFNRNRKKTIDSVVDSPLYTINNKLWLVKHSNSGLYKGISVGYYAVYHESEMEVVDPPTSVEKEDDDMWSDY